jgi:hypothetical protein
VRATLFPQIDLNNNGIYKMDMKGGKKLCYENISWQNSGKKNLQVRLVIEVRKKTRC